MANSYARGFVVGLLVGASATIGGVILWLGRTHIG
jgi:hypothetical protein